MQHKQLLLRVQALAKQGYVPLVVPVQHEASDGPSSGAGDGSAPAASRQTSTVVPEQKPTRYFIVACNILLFTDAAEAREHAKLFLRGLEWAKCISSDDCKD